ncbi:MAG TPA: hypothetical protein VLK85_19985 [Ramlibacter sp.]|nr:hypothetical protein [Ramlibacter sp.]
MEQHSLKMVAPTTLQVERWAPLILSGLATAGWWWFEGEIAPNFAKELLAALISAASVAAGFLTTALSILLPLATTTTGSKLAKSGYREILFRYMRSAIYSCMALAGVSVFAFFTLTVDSGPSKIVSALLVFNAMHSATALLRVAEILMSLFERASEPDDKGG